MKNTKKDEARRRLAGDRSGTRPMLLTELIDAVKHDLFEPGQIDDREIPPMLQISEVTIETEVVARRDIRSQAGGNLFLVNLEGEAAQSNEATHRISVKLTGLNIPEDDPRKRLYLKGAKGSRKGKGR